MSDFERDQCNAEENDIFFLFFILIAHMTTRKNYLGVSFSLDKWLKRLIDYENCWTNRHLAYGLIQKAEG